MVGKPQGGRQMTRETVVVGIDQSVQSEAALQWAADYARRTGATLRAVAVHPRWSPSLPYSVGVAGIPMTHEPAMVQSGHVAMQHLFDSIRPESHW
ncbi:universal stress protein [Microlunatus sp. Gsoil 973]|uniref:universal stress protein n=1 Tax=Microlunatus sp. Gsoil 973 TaxID=2672569 RepID=UPI00351AE977